MVTLTALSWSLLNYFLWGYGGGTAGARRDVLIVDAPFSVGAEPGRGLTNVVISS